MLNQLPFRAMPYEFKIYKKEVWQLTSKSWVHKPCMPPEQTLAPDWWTVPCTSNTVISITGDVLTQAEHLPARTKTANKQAKELSRIFNREFAENDGFSCCIS